VLEGHLVRFVYKEKAWQTLCPEAEQKDIPMDREKQQQSMDREAWKVGRISRWDFMDTTRGIPMEA